MALAKTLCLSPAYWWYAAFGRSDIPAILEQLAPRVRMAFLGFGEVAAADDIQAFEPRERIGSGDSVTVHGQDADRAPHRYAVLFGKF